MAAIGVDLDDVLYPWYDRAHRACLMAGIANGVTPTTWYPYEEYGVTREQWYAALADVTRHEDCWLYSGPPAPRAIDPLHRLKAAGHSIHLVTARGYLAHPANVQAATARWLEQWMVPHDTLTFSKDKTVVHTDFFLDDNADNVRAVRATGSEAFLMDQPWNQDSELPRVKTVEAFVRIVLGEW